MQCYRLVLKDFFYTLKAFKELTTCKVRLRILKIVHSIKKLFYTIQKSSVCQSAHPYYMFLGSLNLILK